jgi:hypothetical protein
MDAQVQTSGAALRDAGIATTLAAEQAEWRARYRRAAFALIHRRLAYIGPGFTFSSHDIRTYAAKDVEIGEPHHPNVWSAAFAAFLRELRREFRVEFYRIERAWRFASAHSRNLPVYRVEGRL